MARIDTVIIGGGQAGLAMSRCLSDLGIEHVVLERGKVAQRWRSQSWDSLHLLTPNWMTRLPGFEYDGDDGDGYMSARELIGSLERYAVSSEAPVVTDTEVQSVERSVNGFRVATNRGIWSASFVVVATGYCDRPAVPAVSRSLSPSVRQMVPTDYRRPEQLPAGGVLIVGASSTGVQLADEIQRSGRQVTLAVGRHTRLPRRYRGHDIFSWLDRLGVLSQSADAVHNIERSRHRPSLQLVGRPDHSSLDLAVLHDRGVRLVGRVRDIEGERVTLADDLAETTAAADIKMTEISGSISSSTQMASPRRREDFDHTARLAADTPLCLDLKDERIDTVIWATGYRRTYPWLRVPTFDFRGEIMHKDGVTPVGGLYVLGLNFQRRRNSSLIDGVGDDAWVIANEIARSMVSARVA
jgi:putative flavoprotein involved in K+ transport